MEVVKIEEIEESYIKTFLEYLYSHLSENGTNNFFFLPLMKEQSNIGNNWEDKFRIGMKKQLGEVGWRKLWVAKNGDNNIIGHIDIRHRNELNTQHRVVLGMGTDRHFRKKKVGQHLLEHVIAYCKKQTEISWLDLDVMANNIPAIRLYEKMDFKQLGYTADMFRIHGRHTIIGL